MKVWIVEVWNGDRRRWEPCAAAALSRSEGLPMVKAWKRANPGDKFQLVQYVKKL